MDLSRLNRICIGKANMTLIKASHLLGKMDLTLEEFYADREFTEFEKAFQDDLQDFRALLAIADGESLRDIRKAITNARRDTLERKEAARSGPSKRRGA